MRKVLTALLAFALFAAVPVKAGSLEKVFSGISPSIAALYAQTSDGSLRFLCSTTAVEKQAKREGKEVLEQSAFGLSLDEHCSRHTQDLAQIREEMDPDKQMRHLLLTTSPATKTPPRSVS